MQHVTSTSLSGNATQFNTGGSAPYSDVLWTNPLIGQNSTQNLPDTGHALLPTLHNFTYDAWVYVTNYSVTQNLEFDINLYMNGVGMIWGTQCSHLSDGDWDIWNDASAAWVSTGIGCNLKNNAWNHVTIQRQWESNNDLLYQSITQNGVTSNIDRTVTPFSVPASWWGITVNYQMDGNSTQSANTTYLDNFSFFIGESRCPAKILRAFDLIKDIGCSAANGRSRGGWTGMRSVQRHFVPRGIHGKYAQSVIQNLLFSVSDGH